MFDFKFRISQQLKSLITQHEKTAEEYFQDIGDEEKGKEYLAKADAIREVLNWIEEQRKLPRYKKITQ